MCSISSASRPRRLRFVSITINSKMPDYAGVLRLLDRFNGTLACIEFSYVSDEVERSGNSLQRTLHSLVEQSVARRLRDLFGTADGRDIFCMKEVLPETSPVTPTRQ